MHLRWDEVRAVAAGLLNAVAFLQQHRVVHRDFKPGDAAVRFLLRFAPSLFVILVGELESLWLA
jgi:hypothetical protein